MMVSQWLAMSILIAWSAVQVPKLAAASYLGDQGSTVMVKLKAKNGSVSMASVALAASTDLDQFVTLPVPKGKSAEQYIAELEASGDVEYAEPNHRIKLYGYASDPQLATQYHLSLIKALEAWETRTDAAPVKVCVIDTGVDSSHPDLVGNMAVSTFNAADSVSNASDEDGHGTMVAGIIGATGNNSLNGAGVTWRTQLLACKIFPNGSNVGDIGSAKRCLQWCMDQGAQVSCNSWGLLQTATPSRSLYDIIAAANGAGHVTVFAAGNDGINLDASDAKTYPASFTDLPNLISVASTDREGRIAGIGGGSNHRSNYGGSTVTIAAPGVDILSTAVGGNMSTGSGTSFAAPQVAGAVALLVAEARERGLSLVMQPCQYKALLVNHANPVPELNGKVQANGLLNVNSALAAIVAGDIPPCPRQEPARPAQPSPPLASNPSRNSPSPPISPSSTPPLPPSPSASMPSPAPLPTASPSAPPSPTTAPAPAIPPLSAPSPAIAPVAGPSPIPLPAASPSAPPAAAPSLAPLPAAPPSASPSRAPAPSPAMLYNAAPPPASSPVGGPGPAPDPAPAAAAAPYPAASAGASHPSPSQLPHVLTNATGPPPAAGAGPGKPLRPPPTSKRTPMRKLQAVL